MLLYRYVLPPKKHTHTIMLHLRRAVKDFELVLEISFSVETTSRMVIRHGLWDRVEFLRQQLAFLRRQVCQFMRLFILAPGKLKEQRVQPRLKVFCRSREGLKPPEPGIAPTSFMDYAVGLNLSSRPGILAGACLWPLSGV
ncbi:MAG: hypothetical protein GXY90_08555 [Peptococcaceae bacterium]|nr:hypothetical protein [Peptococcaceae bacterium]